MTVALVKGLKKPLDPAESGQKPKKISCHPGGDGLEQKHPSVPIASMFGIFTYIRHKNIIKSTTCR